MKGVVAAGHPLTAEAGADALRAGGNAVDAAVAAVLMSFATESPLTGPGSRRVHGRPHRRRRGPRCSTSSSPRPGSGSTRPSRRRLDADRRRASRPGRSSASTSAPSSCGTYGTPLGLADALERFGSLPLADLCAAPARAAREGFEITPMQGTWSRSSARSSLDQPEGEAIYAPEGRLLRAGETDPAARARRPARAAREPRGPASSTGATSPARSQRRVLERGGLLSARGPRLVRVEEREPARARYRGREHDDQPAAVVGRDPDRVRARRSSSGSAARRRPARRSSR